MQGMIENHHQLCDAVRAAGLLPFFDCGIPGYDLQARTPPQRWFTDLEGPWEWKGYLLQDSDDLVYAKLLRRKAAFCTLACYAHLCALRRGGMDAPTRYEMGALGLAQWRIYCALAQHGPLPSDRLRDAAGLTRGDFDRAVCDLQMLTYVCIDGFTYKIDRHGRPYGWGVATYALPQQRYPTLAVPADAAASRAALVQIITRNAPHCTEKQLQRLLR